MQSLLTEYPLVIKASVAWGEMDAMAHVNNIIYFRYFENARIAYFEKLGYMEHMEEFGIGPILASTQCHYRWPLTYPDEVSIGAKVSELSADRFVMKYCVVSKNNAKLAAEGEGLIISYDYRNNRKAALPDAIREKIIALEGSASGTKRSA